MVTLTYGDARVGSVDTAPKTATATTTVATPRKHWFVRLFDAMMEARMQQAMREVRMYTRLIPYTVDENGKRTLKTGSDVPAGGW